MHPFIGVFKINLKCCKYLATFWYILTLYIFLFKLNSSPKADTGWAEKELIYWVYLDRRKAQNAERGPALTPTAFLCTGADHGYSVRLYHCASQTPSHNFCQFLKVKSLQALQQHSVPSWSSLFKLLISYWDPMGSRTCCTLGRKLKQIF